MNYSGKSIKGSISKSKSFVKRKRQAIGLQAGRQKVEGVGYKEEGLCFPYALQLTP